MKLLILFILTSFFLTDKLSTNDLAETKWSFIKVIDKNNNTTLLADTTCKTTIYFQSNGRYSGFSGWNEFYGLYEVKEKKQLHMDTPEPTKVKGLSNCKLGETLYIHYKNSKTFLLKDNTLTILSTDNIELVFKKL